MSVDSFLEHERVFLSVHVVIFLACDCHLLEGAEAGDHGAANPRRVLAVQVCINIDIGLDWDPGLVPDLLGSFASLATDLLVEAFVEAGEQCCAAGEHDVIVKVYFQVVVTLLNGLEADICETAHL